MLRVCCDVVVSAELSTRDHAALHGPLYCLGVDFFSPPLPALVSGSVQETQQVRKKLFLVWIPARRSRGLRRTAFDKLPSGTPVIAAVR